MAAYFLEIEVAGIPPSNNQIIRQRNRKVKLDWKERIRLATGGRIPDFPLTRAEVRFVRYSSKMQDYDNLVGSFKMVLDILVTLGILASDNWGVVGAPQYEQEYANRNEGKIKIFVANKKGASGSCHIF